MEGSATQVNIMSNWMAPSASSRREVRMLEGEGVGAGLQKRGCGQGAQERARGPRATGLLAAMLRATTMAAAVTTPMVAAAVVTRCILKAGGRSWWGRGVDMASDSVCCLGYTFHLDLFKIARADGVPRVFWKLVLLLQQLKEAGHLGAPELELLSLL